MKITKNIVSDSKYSIKCPFPMDAEFIVVHNTANDASAANEVKYMINNNNQVSYHFAIDDIEVIQALPLNRNAWHAGDGATGNGNRKGLSIEICYSKSGGDRFTKAELNASKFIAQLLHECDWDISKVKKHQDFSKKYCPHRTLDNGWQRFVDMVKSELIALDAPPAGELYRVRKSWNDAGNQKGAYSDLNNAILECDKHKDYEVYNSEGVAVYPQKQFMVKIKTDFLNVRKSASLNSTVATTVKKGEVYTIIEEKDGWGQLKSGIGWISLGIPYVERI